MDIIGLRTLSGRLGLFKIVLASRLALLFLSHTVNYELMRPDVFISPTKHDNSSDSSCRVLMNGLNRWDAQYFTHIAMYGYTYESSVAFFPLYPTILRSMVSAVSNFLNVEHACLVLWTSFSLNVILFYVASLYLWELISILKSSNRGYLTAILFCINPATIFFIAPYTETLFSLLTFCTITHCLLFYKHNDSNHLCIAICSSILSSATRSNGVLNSGFVIYTIVHYFIHRRKYVKLILYVIITACVTFAPFVFIQYIHYQSFCKSFDIKIPVFLYTYGNDHNLPMPGEFSKHNQSWCYQTFPLSYSYVQSHYWNVGFLKYYEWKQFPNFMLALPVFYLCKWVFAFLYRHKSFFTHFGLTSRSDKFSDNMVIVSCVHCGFLILFCIFFVHIQVSTRMLFSATWIPCYSLAAAFQKQRSPEIKINCSKRLVLTYCFAYVVIGTVMFSNFLPWT